MIKEIRFCLNADEAPSLLGAYAMATELTDKAAMMLSGRLPIGGSGPGRIESAAFAPHATRQISALVC